MEKEIKKEIDRMIASRSRNNPKLLELIMKVISDESKYSKEIVSLCYAIHELDTEIAEDEKTAVENNLKYPDEFVGELKKIKKKFVALWRKSF